MWLIDVHARAELGWGYWGQVPPLAYYLFIFWVIFFCKLSVYKKKLRAIPIKLLNRHYLQISFDRNFRERNLINYNFIHC